MSTLQQEEERRYGFSLTADAMDYIFTLGREITECIGKDNAMTCTIMGILREAERHQVINKGNSNPPEFVIGIDGIRNISPNHNVRGYGSPELLKRKEECSLRPRESF